MKHIASLLLAILISILLLACGDNAAGTSVEEIPEVQELAQDEVEEVPTYADVEGYPKELNGYTHHKLFINGQANGDDAVTLSDAPDTVYVRSLILSWDLDGDGMACSCTDGNNKLEGAAFCACFNGCVAVNHTGGTQTVIDGVAYDDARPFHYSGGDYNGEYFCSTLYLEKMLDATVTFSEDRSAVYLETGVPVDYDDSHIYDFDLSYTGKLKLTNLSDGTVTEYRVNSNTSGSGSGGNNQSAGSQAPAYKQCSMCLGRGSTFCAACGGTGRTMRMVNVMDPVTHNFTMRSESSICLSCGGSGSIRCSACGGTGGHY